MSGTHEGETERTVQKVHLAPLWSVAGGAVGLFAVDRGSTRSRPFGWIAGLLYLVVSNALLARGLRRRGATRFGPANIATAARSTLVGLVTALVATSFTEPISVPLLWQFGAHRAVRRSQPKGIAPTRTPTSSITSETTHARHSTFLW